VHVADAHTILWYAYGDPRLGRLARIVLAQAEDGNGHVLVPSIVLAEALHILEKRGRVADFRVLVDHISRHPNFGIPAFDAETLSVCAGLAPSLELHDRIIAATAIHRHAVLLSRDRRLRLVCRTLW